MSVTCLTTNPIFSILSPPFVIKIDLSDFYFPRLCEVFGACPSSSMTEHCHYLKTKCYLSLLLDSSMMASRLQLFIDAYCLLRLRRIPLPP